MNVPLPPDSAAAGPLPSTADGAPWVGPPLPEPPHAPTPLLLLDVDGPLNPWHKITRNGHQAGEEYTRHHLRPRGWDVGGGIAAAGTAL